MKKYLALASALLICLFAVTALGRNDPVPANKSSTSKTSTANKRQPTAPSFDKTTNSTTDPASIWVVINKQHPLAPKSYMPNDLVVPSVPLRVPGNTTMQLRAATATALEAMFASARQDNLQLMVSSGYRSYDYQVSLYNSYVQSMGQAAADTQSARPGYSEHQSGLSLDIEPVSRVCELQQCFANTPEGQWLVANSYKFGFILRYTPDDQNTTGYESEPWHYRYVGVGLSTEMHTKNITTLEQFFGISGGQNY